MFPEVSYVVHNLLQFYWGLNTLSCLLCAACPAQYELRTTSLAATKSTTWLVLLGLVSRVCTSIVFSQYLLHSHPFVVRFGTFVYWCVFDIATHQSYHGIWVEGTTPCVQCICEHCYTDIFSCLAGGGGFKSISLWGGQAWPELNRTVSGVWRGSFFGSYLSSPFNSLNLWQHHTSRTHTIHTLCDTLTTSNSNTV